MCTSVTLNNKRTRSSRWEDGELKAMIEGFTTNFSILSSQSADTTTISRKRSIYNNILDSINAVGGNNRDVNQIKAKWSNESSRVKKILATKLHLFKKDVNNTGGGEASTNDDGWLDDLPEMDALIAKILPPEAYAGISETKDDCINQKKSASVSSQLSVSPRQPKSLLENNPSKRHVPGKCSAVNTEHLKEIEEEEDFDKENCVPKRITKSLYEFNVEMIAIEKQKLSVMKEQTNIMQQSLKLEKERLAFEKTRLDLEKRRVSLEEQSSAYSTLGPQDYCQ